MPIAVVLILLVVGSLVFHFLSPWTFTELASNWGMVDTTVDITFIVTGLVFVLVNLFVAVAVIRYRHREGARAKYEPENKRLETWLTVVTAVGVAAMLAPGLFVWGKFVDVPEEAHEVEAVGQQWHWTFRYPGADGVFGEVDAERISARNPFGIDPEDPHGQDDVLVYNPEAHLPVDRPVKMLLRSKDVLHNFAVAQFRVKMDLVPGMQSHMWLTPTRTGRFEILCQEHCGMAHFAMRGAVVVDEEDEFEDWLASYPTFADTVDPSPADVEAGARRYAACSACHGQQGEGLAAMNAPKLAGQGAWYLKRQLMNFKNGLRGTAEGDSYGQQMAPMAASLSERDMDNIIAYVQTFPDDPAPATIEGDVANGEKLYGVCAYCHGESGQGNRALNAPRAAGINDWYLARQLQHFKDGIRGAHQGDYYGFQMRFMSKTLASEQAINDLVAYINTL